MKRLYSLTQADRWKIIFLMSTILVIFIITGLVERYKLDRIHTDFSSIYSDRLLPATDIHYISDNLYENRLLLDEWLSAGGEQPFGESFAQRNFAIDSLIKGYEKTYLVKEEILYLQDLKIRLAGYRKIQNQILASANTGAQEKAKQLFEYDGRREFNAIMQNLHHLAAIQPAVGRELIKNSSADFASTNLLAYLRYGVSLLIGMAIMFLIKTSKMMQQPHQKFNLN